MSASTRPYPVESTTAPSSSFVRRRELPALGLPRARENRRASAVLSLLLHALIVMLLVTPFAVHHAIVEIAQGAGGAGPAGGGGGGHGGTGGVQTPHERLQFIQVAPPAAAATTPPEQIVPPTPVPPPEPVKVEPTPTPVVQPEVAVAPPIKVPDVAATPGAGGGTGHDGTNGNGPGTGGGVGTGGGTGRGSGGGPGHGRGQPGHLPATGDGALHPSDAGAGQSASITHHRGIRRGLHGSCSLLRFHAHQGRGLQQAPPRSFSRLPLPRRHHSRWSPSAHEGPADNRAPVNDPGA